MMPGGRSDNSHNLTVIGHFSTNRWKVRSRSVDVQHDESSRRAAEIVNPRHRLLTAVTALVEVDSRVQQTDFIGDRAIVRIEIETRDMCLDPERLVSENSGGSSGDRRDILNDFPRQLFVFPPGNHCKIRLEHNF